MIEGKLGEILKEEVQPEVYSSWEKAEFFDKFCNDATSSSDQMLEGNLENTVEEGISVIEGLKVYDDMTESEPEQDFVSSRKISKANDDKPEGEDCMSSGKFPETDSIVAFKQSEVKTFVHISLVDIVKSDEKNQYFQNNLIRAEHDFVKNLFGFYDCHKGKPVCACVCICERLEYKSKRKRVIQKCTSSCGVKKGVRNMRGFQFDPGQVNEKQEEIVSLNNQKSEFIYKIVEKTQEIYWFLIEIVSLDETLGDAKVLKEKMVVRVFAYRKNETCKPAMVEASWCRILQVARIHNKDVEALLWEANKTATVVESAKAIGVITYDMPDCPQKQYEIETDVVTEEILASRIVTATFETAFNVNKQVVVAVKAAFIKLASCPPISKEEFQELLGKIGENPGGEYFQDVHELSFEYEADTGYGNAFGCDPLTKFQSRKYNRKQVLEKLNMLKLVDLMLERFRHLEEDELASLATIVATCGLSAALAEAENKKQPGSRSFTDNCDQSRRVSSVGALKSKRVEPEFPSLDRFLAQRMTRLEKEVQEANDSRLIFQLTAIDSYTEILRTTETIIELATLVIDETSACSAKEVGAALVRRCDNDKNKAIAAEHVVHFPTFHKIKTDECVEVMLPLLATEILDRFGFKNEELVFYIKSEIHYMMSRFQFDPGGGHPKWLNF